MTKETIVALMLAKFPEMKQYLHLINWETFDQGIVFTTAKIPEPLQSQVDEWWSKLEK